MTLYYQDDYVTLYHGDCLTEHREWLDADVLVTDPPYGVRVESRRGDATKSGRTRVPNAIAGDKDADLRNSALGAWGNRPAIVFGSWRIARPGGIKSLLIWNKEGAYSGPSAAPFFTNHEEIYVIGEGWVTAGKPLRSVLTTTEHRSVAAAQSGHPTPKPVSLMEKLIERCPAGIISDPFSGSGSTLVAAKNLGRKAVGVELEEHYCELIAKRLSQDLLELEWTA